MVLAHEAETKRTTDGVNQDFESEIETFVVPSKRRPPPPIPDGEKEQDSDDANSYIYSATCATKKTLITYFATERNNCEGGSLFQPGMCIYSH